MGLLWPSFAQAQKEYDSKSGFLLVSCHFIFSLVSQGWHRGFQAFFSSARLDEKDFLEDLLVDFDCLAPSFLADIFVCCLLMAAWKEGGNTVPCSI